MSNITELHFIGNKEAVQTHRDVEPYQRKGGAKGITRIVTGLSRFLLLALALIGLSSRANAAENASICASLEPNNYRQWLVAGGGCTFGTGSITIGTITLTGRVQFTSSPFPQTSWTFEHGTPATFVYSTGGPNDPPLITFPIGIHHVSTSGGYSYLVEVQDGAQTAVPFPASGWTGMVVLAIILAGLGSVVLRKTRKTAS